MNKIHEIIVKYQFRKSSLLENALIVALEKYLKVASRLFNKGTKLDLTQNEIKELIEKMKGLLY